MDAEKMLPAATKPSAMPSATTFLLGLNTVLLAALLVLTGAAYHDVATKSAAITEVFTSPTPSPVGGVSVCVRQEPIVQEPRVRHLF